MSTPYNTYEFTFNNPDGNTTDLVIKTSTTATNDSGYGLGYDIVSITGTFDGQTVTGMVGTGGTTQGGANGVFDNVLFADPSSGKSGSFDGIDGWGISFATSDGGTYVVYNNGGTTNFGIQEGNTTSGMDLTSYTFTPACYEAGTQIRTPAGETAVEALAIGDLVLTASGEARRVKWIGRRSYSARFARNAANLHPVCFQAGSLADNVPDRDLWVSPKHAMFLDGVLIPAALLINGATIVQPLPRAAVHYVHVELDRHDVLIANGAAAESFLDEDSRLIFRNAADYAALYPNEPAKPALNCAPRIEAGEVFEAVLRRLAERADARASPAA